MEFSYKQKVMSVPNTHPKSAYFYKIYECLLEDSRMTKKEISERLKVRKDTGGNLVDEAFLKGVVIPPQIRKKSFETFKEYMYFVKVDDPFEVFDELTMNNDVVYHALMLGFADLWVVSKKEISLEGDIIFKGARSDYYVNCPPDSTWDESINLMKTWVATSDPHTWESQQKIETHFGEKIEWDSEDEELFRWFKTNVRKVYYPVLKENLISTTKLYTWFKRLPETCTVLTFYLPKGVMAYDSYLYMVRTECEDFIIDLFSQLPASTLFFKGGNFLFMEVKIEKVYATEPFMCPEGFKAAEIPFILQKLKKKGVIQQVREALVKLHFNKDF